VGSPQFSCSRFFRDVLAGLAGALLLALGALPVAAAPPAFGPASPLSSSAATDAAIDAPPVLATGRNGTWIAAWESNDSLGGTIGTDSDVLFVRSADDGATWSATGVIVFNPRYSGGLLRVSDKGGAVEPASRLDIARGEGTHRIPNFLPDGRHFTFYASPGAGSEPGEVCLGQLGSLDHRCLGISSSSGVPTPSGQLLFVRGKALLAQALDATAGKLSGDAIPLGPEFPSNVGTSGQRAFSAGGNALAFHLGAPSENRLVWMDRAGVERQAVYDRPADWIFYPRLAPDGRRIALVVYRQNETGNIWVLDPARNGEVESAGPKRAASRDREVRSRDQGLALAVKAGIADGRSEEFQPEDTGPAAERARQMVGHRVRRIDLRAVLAELEGRDLVAR